MLYFKGFARHWGRREQLRDPVPYTMMGPSLAFPGEIPKRQNSRDRILLGTRRNYFYETSWPYSPIASSSESCFIQRNSHSSALLSCPPLWNANGCPRLLSFLHAPGGVLRYFIHIAHALHTLSHLVHMPALCSRYSYPFPFHIGELRLGEVKQHTQVMEPGLKPRACYSVNGNTSHTVAQAKKWMILDFFLSFTLTSTLNKSSWPSLLNMSQIWPLSSVSAMPAVSTPKWALA